MLAGVKKSKSPWLLGLRCQLVALKWSEKYKMAATKLEIPTYELPEQKETNYNG